MKELIEALRCSASPYPKNVDCKSCRYRLLEPVNDKIPVPHDTVIDEVKYWESCDVDRIALDAADALEKQEVYKWIHVSERLPETDDLMLVSCRTKKGVNSVNRAYYSNGAWHGSGSMSGVIAWMPLPEPYEVVEE